MLEWISVKDRLPTVAENPVLACFGFSVCMAWYHVASNKWELPSGMIVDADYWMPLPEAPKGGADNG